MYIKDDEINKYFNKLNWKKAHHLFKQQTICQMSVIKDANTYQIIGGVLDEGQNHQCHVSIDKSGNILHFGCDCQNSKPDELACQHIGVLLLKFYGLEMSDIPYSFNQKINESVQLESIKAKQESEHIQKQIQKSHQLIDIYKKQIKAKQMPLVSPVHLIPNIKTSFDRLYLSYKIAHDKSYAIKSIRDFIYDIKTNQVIQYGKTLTTDHQLSSFDHSSQKQIQFIEEYYKQFHDDKTIRLTNENIDDFFYHHFDNLDININFTTIDLNNLTFTIKDEEDFITIENKKTDGITFIGHQYIYYFDYYTLNRYSKACSEALKPLLTLLEKEPLMISHDDISLFSKYIIDSAIPYVNFEGDHIDDYLPVDVSLLVYVDINNNNELTVSLEYRDDQGETILDDINSLILPLKLDQVLETLNQYLRYDDITNMYYLYDEEDIYYFITEILPSLNHSCEIYISEEIKQFNKPRNLQLNAGIHLKNNLLEIDLNSIHVDKEEIKNIILAFQHNKSYHRLKNGEFINLNDETLKEISHLISDLNIDENKIEDGKIVVDKYHSLYIDQFASQSHIQFTRDEQFSHLIDHIKKPNTTSFTVPKAYQPILRDYQVTGFKWLKTMSEYGFGGILADDMGLGKTLQMITLLEDCKDEEHVSIVISPATLIYNWADEINKFSKDLKTLCITGPLSSRQQAIAQIKDYDVVITSYDYIRRDYELYKDYTFYYLILDEAQYIKNQSTKNAQAVKEINGIHRFALTGTPIENSLAELWSIFDFLMPHYLYNYHYFKENFEAPIVRDEDQEKQKKLKQMVEPFILRRTKKEVLNELPDKIEKNVMISFTPEEEKIYLANLSQINTDLQNAIQVNHVDRIQILAMMTRLRQLCCDQRIVYPQTMEPSSKLKACMDIIATAKESGQKILLFSSFTSSLDLIEKELRKNDISYYVLTGSTTKIKRHQLVNAFQKDDTTVFLISLKAGGTGLNLTSASVVIHYDPWWNMSAQNQATDRAYRIGQTNNVQVYKLVMKNSIEERIQKLQEQKQDLSNMFVENNKGTITSMSIEDVVSLFQ